MFTELGCLKDIVNHIETDPTVKPVIHPPRKVSAPLRSQDVNDELDRMKRLEVIDRVQRSQPNG